MKLDQLATQTLQACRDHRLTVATAESCTGGMIGAALTAIAGSSDVVDRGFITYSNQAKMDLLSVESDALDQQGAVSEIVALQMAQGGLRAAKTDLCVAVTGIAGPGGGSEEKPVGLVYLACAKKDSAPIVERHVFEGDRDQVRFQTAKRALELLKIQALVP
ncbi:CinA family protein [Terasakiella sp.]|uniref:CinA family protein n=1 Tax=Terasakiella sp. TaxID=2034861 RepID=UPI003AA85E93